VRSGWFLSGDPVPAAAQCAIRILWACCVARRQARRARAGALSQGKSRGVGPGRKGAHETRDLARGRRGGRRAAGGARRAPAGGPSAARPGRRAPRGCSGARCCCVACRGAAGGGRQATTPRSGPGKPRRRPRSLPLPSLLRWVYSGSPCRLRTGFRSLGQSREEPTDGTRGGGGAKGQEAKPCEGLIKATARAKDTQGAARAPQAGAERPYRSGAFGAAGASRLSTAAGAGLPSVGRPGLACLCLFQISGNTEVARAPDEGAVLNRAHSPWAAL
jgi:hypothetical protein